MQAQIDTAKKIYNKLPRYYGWMTTFDVSTRNESGWTEKVIKQLKDDFKHGLNLIREKTGKHRFFITKSALLNPEAYISQLYKDELRQNLLPDL